MNKTPSIHLNLNDETLFKLNKINKIEYYFTTEIKKREAMNKILNKYIAAFDYIDIFFVSSKWRSIYFLLAFLELL